MITTKKTIRVTQKNIREASRFGGGTGCPVALAMQRTFKSTAAGVCAGPNKLFAGGLAGLTPKRVKNFMSRWDGGASVRPFSFVLTLSKP